MIGADLYVPAGGDGCLCCGGKYHRFGRWLARSLAAFEGIEAAKLRTLEALELTDDWRVKMPELGVDRQLGFINGRHRFAWLRDHGARSLPACVDTSEAAKIRRRFGGRIGDCRVVMPDRA